MPRSTASQIFLVFCIPVSFELCFVTTLLCLFEQVKNRTEALNSSQQIISSASQAQADVYSTLLNRINYASAGTALHKVAARTSIANLERSTRQLLSLASRSLTNDERAECENATRSLISLITSSEADLVCHDPVAALVSPSDWQKKVLTNILILHDGYSNLQIREERRARELSTQQKALRDLLVGLICIGVVVNLLITLMLSVVMNRRMIRGLEGLSKSALQYLEGNSFKPSANTITEIQDLSRAFSQIVYNTEYSRTRLRTLFNCSPSMLCQLSMHGTVEAVNPAFKRTLLFDENDQLENQHFSNFVLHSKPVEDSGLFTPGDHTLQVTMSKKDGSLMETEWTVGCSIIDGKSYCIVHDVNERAREEAALRERESRITALLNSMLVGVLLVDERGEIEASNSIAEKILGTIASTQPQQKLRTILLASQDITPELFLEDCCNEPRVLQFTTNNSTSISIEFGARKLIEAKKRKFVLNILDVTERRHYDELKRQFNKVLSDQLREPIKLVSEKINSFLRCENQLSEVAKSRAEMVEHNLSRLADLVDELLDLESISLTPALHLRDVDCRKCVAAAIAAVSDIADSSGIAIDLTAEKIIIEADERRIVQAMINLLSNAIKFSRKGDVISVDIHKFGDFARFLVKDQGIGIAPNSLDKIFDPFKQLNAISNTSIKGSGLGLNFVKSIIELHRGSIKVESKPGKGTTFTFYIPIRRVSND